jgi:S-adenosylmethionine hydrolase
VLHQTAPEIPIIDPLRRCARRQSQGIGVPVGGLCALVCGRHDVSLRRRSRSRRDAPARHARRGRPLVRGDNGLFELIERRATTARSFDIDWRPQHLSASFHGRDLFAPVAAMLARGKPPPGQPRNHADRPSDWPDDLAEVVYIDHFGNAMTGLRAAILPPDARLAAAGRVLERARTFGDRPTGAAFWYENSNGLAEIAVNQGRADRDLGLAVGSPVAIVV